MWPFSLTNLAPYIKYFFFLSTSYSKSKSVLPSSILIGTVKIFILLLILKLTFKELLTQGETPTIFKEEENFKNNFSISTDNMPICFLGNFLN